MLQDVLGFRTFSLKYPHPFRGDVFQSQKPESSFLNVLMISQYRRMMKQMMCGGYLKVRSSLTKNFTIFGMKTYIPGLMRNGGQKTCD